MTVHRWFANKACPGDYLYNLHGQIAAEVNARLNSSNSAEQSGVMYRVQTGAFSNKDNADRMLEKVKAAGYDTYMVQVDGLYKIQVGAYSVKSNADAMLAKIKASGFEAFITTNGGYAVSSAPSKKSNAEIAKEIFNGTCSDSRWDSWGTGSTRTERLAAAGYDASAVQAEVNKLF